MQSINAIFKCLTTNQYNYISRELSNDNIILLYIGIRQANSEENIVKDWANITLADAPTSTYNTQFLHLSNVAKGLYVVHFSDLFF